MNDIQEYKLNVHVEPIAGFHMEELAIKCVLFVYQNKAVEVSKEAMVKVDEDNYVIPLTAELVKRVGRGQLKVKVIAEIPDSDFPDGFRTEITEVCTGVVIN
jgi:hypothetical protein